MGKLFVLLCFASVLFSLVTSQSINFSACNLFTNGESSSTSAECATVTTVGDYDSGAGSVEIFIKRIKGSNANGNVLWMVADGPGLSGAMYEPIVSPMVSALGGRYDVYIMDHRGTGQSQPSLHCPVDEATGIELPSGDCVEYLSETYGSTMNYFNTYATIRDYEFITSLIAGDNDEVIFYGSGYGTFVINQLLLAFPDIADAIIYDSAALPSAVEYDTNAADTGSDFLDRCQNFEDCREEIDRNDPEEIVDGIFANFDALRCPRSLSLSRSEVQTAFRNLATDQSLRSLLIPVSARFLRCNSDDIDYLNEGLSSFTDLFYDSLTVQEGESYVLRNHILITEFLRVDRGFQPSSKELSAVSGQLSFSNYFPSFLSELSPRWSWNKNRNVEAYDIANVDHPVLMLAGEFDMKFSPVYSARMADVLDENDSHRFIELPFGGHNVLYNTPTRSGVTCGFELVAQFINQGEGNRDPFELDTDCIQNLLPIDYAAERDSTTELSAEIFGDEDPWGSGSIPRAFLAGSTGFTSGYTSIDFSSNDLPPIPNLSLSQLVAFDSYDTSQARTSFSTLDGLTTGILPPSGFFSSDGYLVGSSSLLGSNVLLVLLSCFVLFSLSF